MEFTTKYRPSNNKPTICSVTAPGRAKLNIKADLTLGAVWLMGFPRVVRIVINFILILISFTFGCLFTFRYAQCGTEDIFVCSLGGGLSEANFKWSIS